MFAVLVALAATPAQAAACYPATSQGSTGPADFATYCWIDFSTYNDALARSSSGQDLSIVLQDGSTMTFRMKVSGSAIKPAAAPSWGGAAVGNTAFLGIRGRPIVYQTAAGTTTVTFSNISVIPPAGVQAVTQYMFVAGDGESTNEGESLSFDTNGSGWQMLDQAGPIVGATYPSTSGVGSRTFTESGMPGTVGAYIVGSNTPTTITTTLVGGGLQGAMFAVRFATIQLNTVIHGTRVDPADQFTFSISATSNGALISSGTSSGTGLGPFTAATLASASAIPLTLSQSLAAGSVSALTEYQSKLTCTNASSTSTPMPSNVTTASYDFGALQFGDTVSCNFAETPYPHLQLTKALGSYRRFSSDQFTMNIDRGTTTVATTTTTGTGNVVGNASTPVTQVVAGTQYSLYETGAGATSLNEYSSTMACINANGGSSTSLPTDPTNATIRPALGDVIGCTITNTRLNSNARLTVIKTASPVSDPANGTTNPKIVPGSIVRYTFTVSNTGNRPVDSNTVWLIDQLPPELLVGTAASPVFTDGSPASGLTFNPSTDIRYSNASSMPASFSGCTYTPTSAYDANVHYVCLNPKGTMAASTGTPPSFMLSINARVN